MNYLSVNELRIYIQELMLWSLETSFFGGEVRAQLCRVRSLLPPCQALEQAELFYQPLKLLCNLLVHILMGVEVTHILTSHNTELRKKTRGRRFSFVSQNRPHFLNTRSSLEALVLN